MDSIKLDSYGIKLNHHSEKIPGNIILIKWQFLVDNNGPMNTM